MMALKAKVNYYRRIFSAYLTPNKSQLTFWHGPPQINPRMKTDELGEYFMSFTRKADFPGHYDDNGVPMLDYRGAIGLQYNPIAIAQFGLGNYNLYQETNSPERRSKFLAAANWLLEHLEQTPAGTYVWYHYFDWEYRTVLKSPWYSGLGQGSGVSLLLRAHKETLDDRYLACATAAIVSFQSSLDKGGVAYTDSEGYIWLEHPIVDPPTHVLDGFLWALWGVYDYWIHTHNYTIRDLFEECVRTLRDNLYRFDTGFWSLAEESGTKMRMLASPFYHALHIVQLDVMYALTGDYVFAEYAMRWRSYQKNKLRRTFAILHKATFKLLYY